VKMALAYGAREVDFVWVNMRQLNYVVSGPKFIEKPNFGR